MFAPITVSATFLDALGDLVVELTHHPGMDDGASPNDANFAATGVGGPATASWLTPTVLELTWPALGANPGPIAVTFAGPDANYKTTGGVLMDDYTTQTVTPAVV